LYTVLAEKKVERLGKDIMGSTHVYDLSKKSHSAASDAVEVSLNPEDLDMMGDQKGLEEKYEEQLRKQTRARVIEREDEDLSDMVADHNAKQGKKRKVDEQKKSGSSGKKGKGFKF
jgi:splicing factor 3B subunit 2